MLGEVGKAVAVLRFGLLTLRYAGLRVALRKLTHQLWGRTVFLGGIGGVTPASPSAFECEVVAASPRDVEEFFAQIPYESREGRYQLLIRKWYHERGFGTPYVSRTKGSHELCSIDWILRSDDVRGWGGRFPDLGPDEAMWENSYTLERFRRQGVSAAAGNQMVGILREAGVRRIKSYIADDNIPELTYMQKLGLRMYEKVLERHILFRVTRRTLESYDPPVPIEATYSR